MEYKSIRFSTLRSSPPANVANTISPNTCYTVQHHAITPLHSGQHHGSRSHHIQCSLPHHILPLQCFIPQYNTHIQCPTPHVTPCLQYPLPHDNTYFQTSTLLYNTHIQYSTLPTSAQIQSSTQHYNFHFITRITSNVQRDSATPVHPMSSTTLQHP